MDNWQHEIGSERDKQNGSSKARDDVLVPATLLPAVLQSLRRPEAPSTMEALLADLRNQDWHRRAEAVRALGMIRDAELTPLPCPKFVLRRRYCEVDRIMRLLIGIFIAFVVAVIAYDLGIRLPLDRGIQLGLVGALALVSWALVSTFSDDEHHAHHH